MPTHSTSTNQGSGDDLNVTLSPNAAALETLEKLKQGEAVSPEETGNLATTLHLSSLATRTANAVVKNIVQRAHPAGKTSADSGGASTGS